MKIEAEKKLENQVQTMRVQIKTLELQLKDARLQLKENETASNIITDLMEKGIIEYDDNNLIKIVQKVITPSPKSMIKIPALNVDSSVNLRSNSYMGSTNMIGGNTSK